MDAVLVAFAVVFVAELGDKTQLVAMGIATRYSLKIVLTGICLAYALTQALAALLGGLLGSALPAKQIGIVAGISFLAFAVWTLLEKDEDDDSEINSDDTSQLASSVSGDSTDVKPAPTGTSAQDELGLLPNSQALEPEVLTTSADTITDTAVTGAGALGAKGSLRIVLGIIGAMMLAEIGDKSMLATAAIAADRNPFGAWLGATAGIITSGCIAVFAGRFLSSRISPRATKYTSAALFGVFGVLMLAEALR